jgi:hypothetical protein
VFGNNESQTTSEKENVKSKRFLCNRFHEKRAARTVVGIFIEQSGILKFGKSNKYPKHPKTRKTKKATGSDSK